MVEAIAGRQPAHQFVMGDSRRVPSGCALPIVMTMSSFSRRGPSIAQDLIRSTRIVMTLGYSTATPQTSPSPWQVGASPMNSRALAVRTGRYVMRPGPMSWPAPIG